VEDDAHSGRNRSHYGEDSVVTYLNTEKKPIPHSEMESSGLNM